MCHIRIGEIDYTSYSRMSGTFINDLLAQSLYVNIAMVLAICLSAIIWNLGTWYYGIPCSSSHTLIGAILGAGLGFATMYVSEGVNWSKAKEIGGSLLLSPAFGFSMAILMMFVLKRIFKTKKLFKSPVDGNPPPPGTRALLITTCTLVSFFHGSNDGQKGVGLVMVILMAFLPAHYALNENYDVQHVIRALDQMDGVMTKLAPTNLLEKEMIKNSAIIQDLRIDILKKIKTGDTSVKFEIRKRILSLSKSISKFMDDPDIISSGEDQKVLSEGLSALVPYTDFAPRWAIYMIAICLGLGTMIGWKRIVVTIGEKIGKSHLTYAEGATAELVAAATIGLSTSFHLPVSTTHVLSSGIAGGMVASGGVKNLQKGTIINIALAWLLTLPASIALAFVFFLLFNWLI